MRKKSHDRNILTKTNYRQFIVHFSFKCHKRTSDCLNDIQCRDVKVRNQQLATSVNHTQLINHVTGCSSNEERLTAPALVSSAHI